MWGVIIKCTSAQGLGGLKMFLGNCGGMCILLREVRKGQREGEAWDESWSSINCPSDSCVIPYLQVRKTKLRINYCFSHFLNGNVYNWVLILFHYCILEVDSLFPEFHNSQMERNFASN